MKGINDISNLQQSTDPKDLFTFKINYNSVENCLGYNGKSLYNGNISETYWRTASDNVLRKYGYFYDNLNRITNAIYEKPYTTTPVTNMYNESLTYDKNGNIQTLKRNGNYDAQVGAIEIDNLGYQYKPNSNQLLWVKDNSSNNSSTFGFKDGANPNASPTTDLDYQYDANGNMTLDNNKGIVSIKYNHLNLPTEINFVGTNKKITYIYNALGVKLEKDVTGSSSSFIGTTNYLNGFQYSKNGSTGMLFALKSYPTAEGYVSNDNGFWRYVYNYTDHLGNVRMSYSFVDWVYSYNPQTSKVELYYSGILRIMEENHYYPFGMKHTNYSDGIYVQSSNTVVPATSSLYKYKYNGKEYQDELGLNVTAMDYRQYDNATGRFNTIDTLSEIDPDKSPYAFARNSPVVLNDPTGFCPECEDYYEQQGYEPYGGQTFTSRGGAEYTFNEIAGQWDRTDLINTLDEVVITGSGFDGTHGNKDDRAGVDQRDDFDSYNFADGIGQLANAASVEWGTTQLAVNRLRQVNLASSVGEAFGIGTQVAAQRLQSFTRTLGTWGNRAGLAGYGLSALSIGSKLLNGENISTSETVNLGINTFFAGVAVASEYGVAVAFAPEIAVIALIYGATELGSYAITGQTLEQNIIGK